MCIVIQQKSCNITMHGEGNFTLSIFLTANTYPETKVCLFCELNLDVAKLFSTKRQQLLQLRTY